MKPAANEKGQVVKPGEEVCWSGHELRDGVVFDRTWKGFVIDTDGNAVLARPTDPDVLDRSPRWLNPQQWFLPS